MARHLAVSIISQQHRPNFLDLSIFLQYIIKKDKSSKKIHDTDTALAYIAILLGAGLGKSKLDESV